LIDISSEGKTRSVPVPVTGVNFRTRLALMLALHGLVGWLVWLSWQPPAPLPATAPASAFSAMRALAHIEVLTRDPRPNNSPAAERARAYLAGILADELGMEVRLVPGVWRRSAHGDRPARTFSVVNVHGRLPGADPAAPGMLLVAHYDSAPDGVGAADNAAAVAAVLEAIRAVRAAGVTLPADLHVLFSDAEELGLVGAAAFMREHGRALNVGAVFNFDARGSGGPAFMHESIGRATPLLTAFARHAPLPLASSLGPFVARHIPNDSDFTVFRIIGATGLNFAFFDDPENYHQPTDDIAHLDLRSVQHIGETMVALIRHFEPSQGTPIRFEPPRPSDENAHPASPVFFNPIGPVLVRYPEAVAHFLAMALALMLLAVLVRRWRNRDRRDGLPRRGAWTLLVPALWLGGGFAIGFGALRAGASLMLGDPRLTALAWFAIGSALLAGAWLQQRFGPEPAPAVTMAAAGVALGFVLPAGSYFVQWPALPAAFAMLSTSPVARRVLAIAASLIGAILFAPAAYYLFLAQPASLPVLTAIAAAQGALIAAAAATGCRLSEAARAPAQAARSESA